jgi:DNA-binding response OmpR family regulator
LRGERREEKGERRDRGVGQEEEVFGGIKFDEYETRNPKSETRGAEPETRNAEPLLLIVEDNPDLRLYLRGILGEDYRILEAGSGRQGLEKALEHMPDLVLTDVMMPEMDGYELSRQLKSDERTCHIPVILLTARAGTESRIEGLETGADDFITKPFDPQELLTRIRNLIDQRRKLQERFIKLLSKFGIEHLMEIETGEMTSMDQKFMQRIIQTVEQSLSDPEFDTDKLSSSVSLSRMQMHRKLVALTGQTPGRFIRTLRLNRAAEMLRSKTGTVTQIAYDVGFNNLSYFARCFQQQFGVLPSEYLR